jgi:hypothetical protein
MLRCHLRGVSVIAPGLPNWETARPILAGTPAYVRQDFVLPSPDILPPTERRRAGGAVRLALSAAQQAIGHAGMRASDVATVFATADGDAENMHRLCETLASEDRQVSPTRFHNSVQNAPAGYWTIAAACREAANTVSDARSVAAKGLLEAATQAAVECRPVMLVAYDLPMPQPFDALRPTQPPCAIALVLTPDAAGALARLTLRLHEAAPASALADDALNALRSTSAVAQLLTVLQACAAGRDEDCLLDYARDSTLCVSVSPMQREAET